MKSILISIKPKWCELMASGKKTIEVRKTRPICAVPFKCYIYCTKDKGISFWTGKRYAYADDRSHNLFDVCGNGKVIGEFICNKIDRLTICGYDNKNLELRRVDKNFAAYDLMAFGKTHCNQKNCVYCLYMGIDGICDVKDIGQPMTRPPQSWCYVEESEQ